MKLGLQVSSLREHLKSPQDVRETFRKIKLIGYNYVQMQYIGGKVSAESVKESLDEAGLVCVSTQDDFNAFSRANIDKITARNLLWRAKYVCASVNVQQDSEILDNKSKYINALSRRFRKNGLIFEIHPLFPSLISVDDISPLDMLLERLDDDILIQADFFHVFMSKTDGIDFIEKYGGRIIEAHFKDCKVRGNGLDMLPSRNFDVLEHFPLTPAGQGVMDWERIIEACKKRGVKYCWAEQEEWEKDAFECMKESFDYLVSRGLETR